MSLEAAFYAMRNFSLDYQKQVQFCHERLFLFDDLDTELALFSSVFQFRYFFNLLKKHQF